MQEGRMRARVAIAAVAALVFGGSAVGQSTRHFNPMVDLLAEKASVRPVGALGAAVAAARERQARDAGAAGTPRQAPRRLGGSVARKTPLELARRRSRIPATTFQRRHGGGDRIASLRCADALVEAGAISKSPCPTLAPLSVRRRRSDRPAKAIETSAASQCGVASIVRPSDTAKAAAGTRALSKGGAAGRRGRAEVGLSEKVRDKATVALSERRARGLGHHETEGPPTCAPCPGPRRADSRRRRSEVFSATVDGASARRARKRRFGGWAVQGVQRALRLSGERHDIEMRMKQGFSVFIIQAFNEGGFKAIEIGRRAGGR
jgi:hypothetical protein